MSDPNNYCIGWICALHIEYLAAQVILDEEHQPPVRLDPKDNNSYKLGRIGEHNIVIVVLPYGVYGLESAAAVSKDLLRSFPNIRVGLMVGVGGGAPSSQADIRLGDVVVSSPTGTYGGVLQYDYGKTIQARKFLLTGHLNQPPLLLLTTVAALRTKMQKTFGGLHINQTITSLLDGKSHLDDLRRPSKEEDRLYKPNVVHQENIPCQEYCDQNVNNWSQRLPRSNDEPVIHYGLIASANQLMRDAQIRDALVEDHGVLCFEMEGAGLMNLIPCIVIRGICDYSDSHKKNQWQGYAAIAAAVYTKELLGIMNPTQLQSISKAQNVQDFTLPFSVPSAPMVTEFIGRSQDLAEIERALPLGAIERKIAVIHGIGGIGKTQLAVAYAKQHSADYSAVLWLDGQEEASLRTSFHTLVKRLHLAHPSRSIFRSAAESKDIAEAHKVVLDWLDNRNNSHWLMVFDNVDEPQLPGVTGLYDLQQFLPSTLHGHILITTRSTLLRIGPQIRLQALKDQERCLQILEKSSGRKDIRNDPKVHELLQKLDGLPLALSIAGAYLSQVPDSINDYLEHYTESWLELQEATIGLPEHQQRTLRTTWEISARRIKERSIEAWQLLQLFSHLSNKDVWYELLKAAGETSPLWFRKIVRTKLSFNYHIQILVAHGVAETQQDPPGYGLHTCVHDWLIATRDEKTDKVYSELALSCIALSVQDPQNAECRFLQRRLLPHADHNLIHHRSHFRDDPRGNFLRHLGVLYHNQSRYEDAIKVFLLALQSGGQPSGLNEQDTIIVNAALGDCYQDHFKISEGKKILIKALHDSETMIGIEDQVTLRIVLSLGEIYRKEMDFAQAEVMYRRAIKGRCSRLGPDNPATLDAMSKLAYLLQRQCKWVESRDLLRQILHGQEKCFGKDHPATLRTLLDITYQDFQQQKFSAIHDSLLFIVEGFAKSVSLSNKTAMHARQMLSMNHAGLKNFAMAEEVAFQTLQICENEYGLDYPDTLGHANTLGIIYAEQLKIAEAEMVLIPTIERCERVLPAGNVVTAATLDSLGRLYTYVKRFAEAEALLKRSFDIMMLKFGANHLHTSEVAYNLGDVYRALGRIVDAEAVYKQATEGYSKVNGQSDTRAQTASQRLAAVRSDMDRTWVERNLLSIRNT